MPHIDWVSFSLPFLHEGVIPQRVMLRTFMQALEDYFPLTHSLIGELKYEPKHGRAPYANSWHSKAGITLFTHPTLPHALVEISATGAEFVGEGDLLTLIDEVQDRITRIDFAYDMRTDVLPSEFAALRDSGRFKSHSEFISQTGKTFYIGSRESDRYCRVYRYNEPHPRHEYLRAEFVLKAEQAKTVVDTLRERSVTEVVSMLGQVFGFTHEAWNVENTGEKLPAWRGSRSDHKTVFWLNAQVAPVLLRLNDEGVLDIEEWVRELLARHER